MKMTPLNLSAPPIPQHDAAMVDRWLNDAAGMPPDLLVANALAVAAAALVAAASSPRDAVEQAVEIGKLFPDMVAQSLAMHGSA